MTDSEVADRGREDPSPTSPDPVELAMEADAGNRAPDSPARLLLVDQRRLVRWQIAGERAGVVLKLLMAAAGVAAAVALGVMAWQAHRSAGVRVEAFSVPPALAAQGITGEVLAARTLDAYKALEGDTLANTVPRQLQNGWDRTARVVIPNTGVSVDEVQTLLRDWLGQDTRVSGELTQGTSGLVLSVRAGESAQRVEASAGDLDVLILRAGEAVYRGAEPERFAAYLASHQRLPEAVAIWRGMALSGPRAQRARALNDLAAAQPPAQAIGAVTRAVTLDPANPMLWHSLAYANLRLGRGEAGMRAAQRSVALWTGAAQRQYAPWWPAEARAQMLRLIANQLQDPLEAARVSAEAGDPRPDQPPVACRQCAGAALWNAGFDHASLGDGAMLAHFSRLAAELRDDADRGEALDAAGRLNLMQGIEDWPALLAMLESPLPPAAVRIANGPEGPVVRAIALAGTGRIREARQVIAPMDGAGYGVMIGRGRVESAAGNWAGADAWFARAKANAPTLPTAGLYRGRSLILRGQPRAAIAELKAAHKLSPKSGKVLETWGEALLAAGEPDAAARKFAAAQPRAPRLGRLHLKWAEALAAAGRTDAARARLRFAASLDLSAADRAELLAQRI